MTAPVRQAHVPEGTACFLDADRRDRALVVRWEASEAGRDMVVLSLWRASECLGTCRLARDEVASLLTTLSAGLAATTR